MRTWLLELLSCLRRRAIRPHLKQFVVLNALTCIVQARDVIPPLTSRCGLESIGATTLQCQPRLELRPASVSCVLTAGGMVGMGGRSAFTANADGESPEAGKI